MHVECLYFAKLRLFTLLSSENVRSLRDSACITFKC